MRRAVLFFDHSIPHTTGHYWVAGFRQLGWQVDVRFPREASGLAEPYDLYLSVDDATHYLFPERLHPSAFSLSDTHMGYRADRIMARRFDVVFCVHKDGAERLKRDGFPEVYWVPVACAPELYPDPPPAKRYDVAFIGQMGWGRRRRLIESVRRRFPDSFIGQAPPQEMARIYSQARIVFNCGIKRDINMRFFEGLGAGSCVVTNRDAYGLADLFQEGIHFAGYGSEEEALHTIRRLLDNDEAREKIAAAGRAEVLARHTYRHRAEEIARRMDARATRPPRRLPPASWDAAKLKALDRLYSVQMRLNRLLDL